MTCFNRRYSSRSVVTKINWTVKYNRSFYILKIKQTKSHYTVHKNCLRRTCGASGKHWRSRYAHKRKSRSCQTSFQVAVRFMSRKHGSACASICSRQAYWHHRQCGNRTLVQFLLFSSLLFSVSLPESQERVPFIPNTNLMCDAPRLVWLLSKTGMTTRRSAVTSSRIQENFQWFCTEKVIEIWYNQPG